MWFVLYHYFTHHNRSLNGAVFWGIDKLTGHWRSSHMTRGVSELETQWIYKARTYSSCGINVEWDVNAFISNA